MEEAEVMSQGDVLRNVLGPTVGQVTGQVWANPQAATLASYYIP